MPLKNYTTEIPAMKSIGQIQGNLAAHGARAIMMKYNASGEPISLSFIISVPEGEIPFQLPANIEAVRNILKSQRTSHRKGQAANVAWRILKDWVDAQLAIIETEMVTLEQVFLPYMMVNDKKTLYESMVEKGFYLAEGRR